MLDAGPAGENVAIDLGAVGFRSLRVERGADGHSFGLVVNDVEIFSRGICWAPLDPAALSADPGAYRAALEQIRRAGANMVRVPALMTYEPRLVRDTIEVARDTIVDSAELKIRFVVRADLSCEPLNVSIEFVADVEVDSGKIVINRL